MLRRYGTHRRCGRRFVSRDWAWKRPMTGRLRDWRDLAIKRSFRYINEQMIYLHSVSKTVFAKHEGPRLVFRPTNAALPTDRRVAILGDRQQGKSMLLRLLA